MPVSRCFFYRWQNFHSRSTSALLDLDDAAAAPFSQFFPALQACKELRDLDTGKRLHHLSQSLLALDLRVATSFIDMYARCGSVADARSIFDRLPCHDLALLNAMIHGYAENGDGRRALDLFFGSESRQPDSWTYVAAITACSAIAESEPGDGVDGHHRDHTKNSVPKPRALELGMRIHAAAAAGGMIAGSSAIFVGNSLISMYAKCRSMIDARMIFDTIPIHNVVSWNSLLFGYAAIGAGDLALELFARMPEVIDPDARTFVAALTACSSLAAAIDESDPSRLRIIEQKGSMLHSQASRSGFGSSIFVANSLVEMYSKCRNMFQARRVFDTILDQHRNVVSWTSLMLGYAANGDSDIALGLFSKIPPPQSDARALAAALIICGNLADLGTGRRIHAEIRSRADLRGDIFLANCLIDFYGKCGSMDDAETVFGSVPDRAKTVVTWSSLIGGYTHLGDADRATDLFRRMQDAGVRPNGITLLSILTACSHAGLVDSGLEFFDAMSTKLGLRPEIRHYQCLIDLLGRANHLDRAVKLADEMPFEADQVTWKTILAAAKKFANVRVGRLAFESLVKIDGQDAAVYMSMAEIYGRAGLWEEQSRVLILKNQRRAWKKPGLSWWIDPAGNIHSFKAGDWDRHRAAADKLKEVMLRIKAEGYVPDRSSLLHDVSEAEKENILCGHSEKLAIAFALVHTPPGSVIRIAKNLRVCEDCHKATAVLSRVENRRIVCRDSSRFHVFSDGGCSCGGFDSITAATSRRPSCCCCCSRQ